MTRNFLTFDQDPFCSTEGTPPPSLPPPPSWEAGRYEVVRCTICFKYNSKIQIPENCTCSFKCQDQEVARTLITAEVADVLDNSFLSLHPLVLHILPVHTDLTKNFHSHKFFFKIVLEEFFLFVQGAFVFKLKSEEPTLGNFLDTTSGVRLPFPPKVG